MLLNKEQILSADDRPTEIIECPEWGGDVKIRALSAHDKDQCCLKIYCEQQATGIASNYKSYFIASSIVDEEGNLLFTVEEVEALGLKNARVIERIYNAVAKMNLLDKETRDAAKKN